MNQINTIFKVKIDRKFRLLNDKSLFLILLILQCYSYIYYSVNPSTKLFLYSCYAILIFGAIIMGVKFFTKKLIFDRLAIIVLGMIVYELLITILFGNLTANYFLYIISWKLCFLVAYTDVNIKKIDVNRKIIIFLMICLILPVAFQKVLLNIDYESSISIIAAVYVLLSAMPFALISKSKTMKYIYMIVAIFILIISQKRTGFLAILLGLVGLIYAKYFINKKVKIKFLGIIFLAILVFFLYYLLTESNLGIVSRLENITIDNGNGRVDLWVYLLENFSNSSFLHILFGYGSHATNQLIGTFAHNDYINILYDFGIIGLFLYLWFIITIIKKWISMCKNDYENKDIFLFAIIELLILSMFSIFFVRADIVNCILFYIAYELNYCKRKDIQNSF